MVNYVKTDTLINYILSEHLSRDIFGSFIYFCSVEVKTVQRTKTGAKRKGPYRTQSVR